MIKKYNLKVYQKSHYGRILLNRKFSTRKSANRIAHGYFLRGHPVRLDKI